MDHDRFPFSTLRKIRDGGHSLTVWCSRCGHDAPAPVEALARKIGWDTDFLAPDILPFLRCGVCELKVRSRGRDEFGNKISIKLSPAEALVL